MKSWNELRRKGLSTSGDRGVYVHAALHCVANRPPKPARYRMLYETRSKHRRLFRMGDSYDPQRAGSKITPEVDEIPPGL